MSLGSFRRAQLKRLHDHGAVSRETAVAVMSDHTLNPNSLSAMIGLGLTRGATLPFRGDSTRRVSHYWLTPAGIEVAR